MKDIFIEDVVNWRHEGLSTTAIKAKLTPHDLSDEERRIIMMEAEELFLKELERPEKAPPQSKLLVKSLVLFLMLGMMVLMFFDHAYLGFGGLVLLWLALKKSNILGKQKRGPIVFDKQ